MIRTKFILVAGLFLVLNCHVVRAQKTSYNYTHAVEAIQNDDIATGKSYLLRELGTNPKNGYAWSLMCVVYAKENKADSSFLAIDNAIKFIPKTDEETLVKAYNIKAKLLTAVDMADQVLPVYNEGVKRMPKNVSMLKARADYFNETLEDYAKARSDYQKALSLDPGNLDIMCDIGDTYVNEDKLSKGMEYYNKVLSVDPSHPKALLNRAISYCTDNNYEKGIGDLLTLVKTDNIDGYKLLLSLTDSIPIREIVIEQLNTRMKADPKEQLYPFTLGSIYSNAGDHSLALKAYQQAFDLEKNARTANNIAREYYYDNHYADAEKWVLKAEQIARDSSLDMSDYLSTHGDILYDQGKYSDAIKQYTASLDANNDAGVHYMRGMAYIMRGLKADAFKDMDAAITLSDDPDARIYLMRGWLNMGLGKRMEAQGDFRKAIEKDSVGTPSAATFISQHFLGIDNTAKENVAKCLKDASNNRNALFDVACFYALLDDKVMATHHLELSIEKGYTSWAIMRDHPWLQSLKGYKDYEKLLKVK